MTFNEWWNANGAKYSADALHMSEYHMAYVVWDAACREYISPSEDELAARDSTNNNSKGELP
jgi:hypothetical protein